MTKELEEQVRKALEREGLKWTYYFQRKERHFESPGFGSDPVDEATIDLYYATDHLSVDVLKDIWERHLKLERAYEILTGLSFVVRKIYHPSFPNRLITWLQVSGQTYEEVTSPDQLKVGRRVEIGMASWSGYQPVVTEIMDNFVRVLYNQRSYLIKPEKIVRMLPEEIK